MTIQPYRPDQLSNTRVGYLQKLPEADELEKLSPEQKSRIFKKFENDFTGMGWRDFLGDYFGDGRKKRTLDAIALNYIASLPGGMEYLSNEEKLAKLVEGATYLLNELNHTARNHLLTKTWPESASGEFVARIPVAVLGIDICVVLFGRVVEMLSGDEVCMMLTSDGHEGGTLLEQMAKSAESMTVHNAKSATSLIGKFAPADPTQMELMIKIYQLAVDAYNEAGKYMEAVVACEQEIKLYDSIGTTEALSRKAEALSKMAKLLNKQAKVLDTEARRSDTMALIFIQTFCPPDSIRSRATEVRESEAKAHGQAAAIQQQNGNFSAAADAWELEARAHQKIGNFSAAAIARELEANARKLEAETHGQATLAKRPPPGRSPADYPAAGLLPRP